MRNSFWSLKLYASRLLNTGCSTGGRSHSVPPGGFVLLMAEAVWEGCGWSCSGMWPQALTDAGDWARIYFAHLSVGVLTESHTLGIIRISM